MKTTNIKKLREQKKIRQKDMAKLLDYTPISYNRIENGSRGLPANKAAMAAEILGCTMDDIFLVSNYPKQIKEN